MSADKRLYQIALTLIPGVGDITARNILKVVGEEEAVFKSNKKSLQTIQGISSNLAEEILNADILKRAEEELSFVDKNKIDTLFINDDNYPKRLIECSDAPILLYYKGTADLNSSKIVSIVGTRKSTNYGNHFCENFIQELSGLYPDIIIVSGLAYGIDIHAHEAALKHGLPTIGVLAHGLDRIYPSAHRKTAMTMIEKGGLLTDFVSGTDPERYNFVKRNRIVAGMCDAVIVVESDAKGGSLITAEIANSYCKDVFALPGRISDKYSLGCNKLIASHKADLLESTEHFLQQMGWDKQSAKRKEIPRQQDLFIALTADEQAIVDELTKQEALHIDHLAKELNRPAYQLFSTLLELEMKNMITHTPGNLYSLTNK